MLLRRRTLRATRFRPWGLLLSLILAAGAEAHKPSDSYLWIEAKPDADLAVRWDIAFADLEHAVGLDANGDGSITWGEVKRRSAVIGEYARAHLGLSRGGAACPPGLAQLRVDEHSDGHYAVLQFDAECAEDSPVTVEYSLLFDLDPTHRGLMVVDDGTTRRTAILGPEDRVWTSTSAEASAWSTFARFVNEGIRHIWIGYDHVAFLLLLLLPAGLAADGRRVAAAAGDARAVVFEALKIVTSFTAAHSITLGLAATGVVALPTKPVEIAIAASVVIAGLYNLLPRPRGRQWIIAFCFGLVHGFGFASVLADLDLADTAAAVPLAAFNIGVELGQLVIVSLVLPIIILLRHRTLYRRVLVRGGSFAVALLASYWLLERMLY